MFAACLRMHSPPCIPSVLPKTLNIIPTKPGEARPVCQPAAIEALNMTANPGTSESCLLVRQVFDETEGYEDDEIPPGQGQQYEKVNWLKAGFLGADKLLTVSPNYAEEIAGDPQKGVELDDVIRSEPPARSPRC